jgi:hypothetical protein
MKLHISVLLLVICWMFVPKESVGQSEYDVDVCVYGGTAAGVTAAYTVEKLGKNALLIEPGKRLGGMSSGGLGYTDIGNKFAITGLARDFYRKLGSHYGKFEQWTFEPKVAENIFKDYARRGGYPVLYEYRIKEVIKDNNRVTEILIEHAMEPGREIRVRAKMFIDCGYEGDLMAKSGISYVTGREDNKEFNETINGVQLMDGHQFPPGIDPYINPGKPKSGLLWGIQSERLQSNGKGDKKIQAYNFRICLTSDPLNRVTITRPADYDSSRYELLLRLFEKFPEKKSLNDYFIWSKMPNRKTDINNRGGFSTDMIGMNYEYPEGSYEDRAQIIKKHESYTKGLLYFYGHDSRVPDTLRQQMLQWGYPRDEYVEYGNWSPQLYIREARRMRGQYVMTQHNCQGKEVVKDGIGLAAYTMDSHNCQRVVVDGMVKNEGNVEVGGFGPYPISYGAIVPKKTEVENVLVPVCLSATHIAYGSIRMEPVFMVLAQSAATAAVMAIDNNSNIQNVDVKLLQEELKSNPLADGTSPEVLTDNEDRTNVTVTGRWMRVNEGGYGSSFLLFSSSMMNHPRQPAPQQRNPDGSQKPPGQAQPPPRIEIPSVKFTLNSEKTWFKVYLYIPKVSGISSRMAVKVFNGESTRSLVLDPTRLSIEGQTSGEWVELGEVQTKGKTKPYVEVSTENAQGSVVADAVLWLPMKQLNKN